MDVLEASDPGRRAGTYLRDSVSWVSGIDVVGRQQKSSQVEVVGGVHDPRRCLSATSTDGGA